MSGVSGTASVVPHHWRGGEGAWLVSLADLCGSTARALLTTNKDSAVGTQLHVSIRIVQTPTAISVASHSLLYLCEMLVLAKFDG